MDKEIIYDFAVSNRCRILLNDTAAEMDNEIIKKKDVALHLVTGAVDCLSTEILLDKYEMFVEDMATIRDEMLFCAEKIDRLSQRMRLAEEEAQRIASTGNSGE